MHKRIFFLKYSILITLVAFTIDTTVLGFGSAKNRSPKPAKNSQLSKVGSGTEFVPNKIIVKFKDRRAFGTQLSTTGISSVDKILNTHNITKLEQVIKGREVLKKATTTVAIESIYYAYFTGDESSASVASALNESPLVEYAEPLYYYRPLNTPDDPLFVQQNYFSIIQAEQAWDVVKGEQGNVVIGVVDAGTDINHPDLAANLWVNPGEIANNGLDDDNNGFVDDVNGWNFGNNSNDPSSVIDDSHGTQTAGIAAAVSNNGKGVAGTSWNAALMPVNVVQPDGTGLISTMFDGIIYAASNGADIINLSLGRAIDGGPPLNSEQEMINLATDLGTLVVSSAGNRGNATPQYPSSYKNVLSVAATTNDDIKTSFSNYGLTVDIAAPGVDIQSTLNKGEYGIIPFGGSSGTSFSSPIVAGVAALVKTQHPDWLPIQVGEQVRVTADDIDALNPTFAGLLGGRVNALRAVTETNVPSLRIANMIINDTNGNGVIQPDENVEVLLNFVNYLAPAANVNLTLQTNDRFVTLVKSSATIASLGTLDTTSTPLSFEFQVSKIAPSGRALNFIIDIANGTYQDKERINLVVEPTFGTVAINNVDVSLTNLGRIGFADPSNSLGGIGFKFNNGPNLLFEGAIIAGTGPNRISNAARGLLIGGTNLLFNQDFSSAEGGDLQINTPGLITDQESFAILEDNKSNTPMDLRITQESFAVTAPPNDDFILLRYTIANQGQNSLDNFHFGFFFDWDIDDANPDNVQRNLANYDAARNLGYVSFSTTFVGAAIVSSDGNISYRALNNNDQGPDFAVNDGFTDEEKWQAISSGIQVTRKGPADVSHVIATGPFAITPNDTIQLGLALLAGTGFQDLQANADAAKAFWESLFTTDVADEPIAGIPTEFVLRQNYPNPFNPTTTIRYEIPEVSDVELTIHNLLGQKIRTFKERQNAGTYSIQWDGKNEAGKQVASGVYLYRITAGEYTQTRKMLLLQ